MKKSSLLVLNLLGSNKNILRASNEIREYIKDKYFVYKEVNNLYLQPPFHPYTIGYDVYINKCNLKCCIDIQNLNENLEKQNVLPCSMLIHSNSKDREDPFFILQNCPYIHKRYNVDSTIKEKESFLFHLFFQI